MPYQGKSRTYHHQNIDYRNSAIGSASCGPELMKKYRFDEKEFSFGFRIRLGAVENIADEFEA